MILKKLEQLRKNWISYGENSNFYLKSADIGKDLIKLHKIHYGFIFLAVCFSVENAPGTI